MSADAPLELSEDEEVMLDADANTLPSLSFIDFLENKDGPVAEFQTKTNRSSNDGESSSNSSTTTINNNSSNTHAKGEIDDGAAEGPLKDNETMLYDYSSPGFIAPLENKDMTNAFHFTRANRHTADTSANITTDELSASEKNKIAHSNKLENVKNNSKGRKHERKEIILKRLLVSKDKKSNKWRAYFFYDKFRQAAFETQEECHLFHGILRKKLAQPESYNDKESMDELVAHIRETILNDKTKKMKRKREEEVETISLSDSFSSSLKSSNELNLNVKTFKDEARTDNNEEKRANKAGDLSKAAAAKMLKPAFCSPGKGSSLFELDQLSPKRERQTTMLSDNFSSLKSDDELSLSVEIFNDENVPKRTSKSKTNGFTCAFTTFDNAKKAMTDQNTKCWKAYFNYDKFRFLGSFATNNEANHALEAAWNTLDQSRLYDENNLRRGGFCLKEVNLCFDEKCRKWRSYFTFDKRRQIGPFVSREKGLLALEMLHNTFHQSSANDKASIDAIVKKVHNAVCSQNITSRAVINYVFYS